MKEPFFAEQEDNYLMGGFEDESDSPKKKSVCKHYSFIKIKKPQLETTINTTIEETMECVSPFLVTLTCPVCLFLTTLSHPLDTTQQYPHSLMLSLLAMVVFSAFASSVAVMICVGARFNRIQIITLLVSTMSQLISSSSFIVFLLYVPVFTILFAGWYAAAKSRPEEMVQSM